MNDWNTEYCAIRCVELTNSSLPSNTSQLYKVPEFDSTLNNSVVFSNMTCNDTRSPAKEYFK